MRAWEMHPLCCLAGEWPGSGGGGLAAGDRSPPPPPAAEGEAPAVAGVLYKWTNIGKGWRPRWFAIRGGVLAYSKIRRRVAAEPHPAASEAAGGVRLIGVARGAGGAGERPIGFVHLKVVNSVDTTLTEKPQLELFKHDCSSSGKCSEYSNTESSDDVGKQEISELSDGDEFHFYDTRQSFSDWATNPDLSQRCLSNASEHHKSVASLTVDKANEYLLPNSKRRTKLPDPAEKEKGVSLWSMIKDNVGKDLTRVCLPVYFNEPLSSLQKCFEELEYSYLLDRAYECGLKGNGLMRILYVAAFAVSGYASTDSRPCKPFNPLLGETYEADYPEKGIRFFSEKVSHHPMVMACHCEGKGWKFWGDSNLKSKFWGQSIQVDPDGVLTLEFDDGETFRWSKVTTTINNLILGRLYCHHHGTMHISGNRRYSCKLTFKEQSFLDRNPRQVQGVVKDLDGTKVATLAGKWDESVHCIIGYDASKVKCHGPHQSAGATLLWEKNEPSANPTRYNLSSFAITLNELTPELKEKLPPTDSRLRPDQRHLENGEYEKANAEKLRLETRQRMVARKMQESGWKPRWFQRGSEDGTFRYVGGYWEAREERKWDGCNDIFVHKDAFIFGADVVMLVDVHVSGDASMLALWWIYELLE
nr:unnamed protein product [Digitaria exilis]